MSLLTCNYVGWGLSKNKWKIISDRFFARRFSLSFWQLFKLTNSICAAVSNSNIRLSAILNGICGTNKLKKSKLTNLQNSNNPSLEKLPLFIFCFLFLLSFGDARLLLLRVVGRQRAASSNWFSGKINQRNLSSLSEVYHVIHATFHSNLIGM